VIQQVGGLNPNRGFASGHHPSPSGESGEVRGTHPGEDDPIMTSVDERVEPQRNGGPIEVTQSASLCLEIYTK
jgi:hypothetical protein